MELIPQGNLLRRVHPVPVRLVVEELRKVVVVHLLGECMSRDDQNVFKETLFRIRDVGEPPAHVGGLVEECFELSSREPCATYGGPGAHSIDVMPAGAHTLVGVASSRPHEFLYSFSTSLILVEGVGA